MNTILMEMQKELQKQYNILEKYIADTKDYGYVEDALASIGDTIKCLEQHKMHIND